MSRSMYRKVERSESVIMKEEGGWEGSRSSEYCACETSRYDEGKDTTYWSYDDLWYALDELQRERVV